MKLIPIDYEKLAANCKTFGEVDHVANLQRAAQLLAEGAKLQKLTPREQDYAMVLIKAGNIVVQEVTGTPLFAVDDAKSAAPKASPVAAAKSSIAAAFNKAK